MVEKNLIGIFMGLEAATYEYVAEIIAPYNLDFSIDIGSFLLIDGLGEQIVARVMQYFPRGELTSFMGQKWLSDVALEGDVIGSDIKRRKISYRVRIKILGALSENEFKPGLLKIPHITSHVYKPNTAQVKKILNKALEEQKKGVDIGCYALDETIDVKFDLKELNAKRTFIFARAGYGKSNLMKLIASQWSADYGGLLIFDPEGEYALTDVKNRPGIMDKREAIFITNRNVPEDIPNVYKGLRLNLKEFNPRAIIPLLVTEKKHDNIFFSKLMGLRDDNWRELVDLLEREEYRADEEDIKTIVGLKPEDKSVPPIKNNLVPAIRDIHDSNSQLINIVEEGLRQRRVVIVDISLLNSNNALKLSNIIVNRILKHNQKEFTNQGNKDFIEATFVVEEAQSVLSTGSDIGPFVELAKEGRKYYLGGIFVTQQPYSIQFPIISQGDNFFVFHLLSRGDLQSLQKANAHYSDDILTQILNEPIKGKCYMWTSEQPFVIPVKVKNFENCAIPNQSKLVQKKSNILGSILKSISEEFESPLFINILKKIKETEIEYDGQEKGKKTVGLYNKLTKEEKAFLRERNRLQSYEGKEFAVKFAYYDKLVRHLSNFNCSE